jgi:hypothetical protein
MGQTFVKASQQGNAVKIFFAQASTTARNLTPPVKRGASLFAIARSEFEAGEINEAHDLFDQALSDKL